MYNSDKVEYSNSICKIWVTVICKSVNGTGKRKFDVDVVGIGESKVPRGNYYFIYDGLFFRW